MAISGKMAPKGACVHVKAKKNKADNKKPAMKKAKKPMMTGGKPAAKG